MQVESPEGVRGYFWFMTNFLEQAIQGVGRPSHGLLILAGQSLTLLGHPSSHRSRYSANRFLPHFGSFRPFLTFVGFLVRVLPVQVPAPRYEVINLVHIIVPDLLYKIILKSFLNFVKLRPKGITLHKFKFLFPKFFTNLNFLNTTTILR